MKIEIHFHGDHNKAYEGMTPQQKISDLLAGTAYLLDTLDPDRVKIGDSIDVHDDNKELAAEIRIYDSSEYTLSVTPRRKVKL